jgi:RNA polymerase sigma-70 factor (ECF subfamily)
VEPYDIFYKENKDRIFSYLLRLTGDTHLAVDIMQESFTRYFSRYRDAPQNCSLLFTIARNAALDSIRKRREENHPPVDEASLAGDPERRLIEKQEFNKMLAAIGRLNPVDRELISLLAAKPFSYKEIGDILNISEANVKIKIHRARIRLREILGNGGQ